jgi:alpha-tubulin suppressor-like RCC1 family protein
LGVCGWGGLAVAFAVTSCGSSGNGSSGNGPGDASTDSGGGTDAGMDGNTQGSMDSGRDGGGQQRDGSMDSGNPAEAGGSGDAGDGASPGEGGMPEGGDSGTVGSGCATDLGGDYVATSAGHVFYTGGNTASSAWTAVTVAGGADLDHVVSVAHSPSFACALQDTGTVWCWAEVSAAQAGTNTSGQIGDGTLTWPATAFVATEVQTAAGPTYLTGIASLTTDGENYYGRPFCAVDTSGGVWCWGQTHPSGGPGALLINTVSSGTYSQPYAIAIANSATPGDLLTGVAQVAAGSNQICVILTSGQVECWGYNTYGALGTATATGGSSNDSDYPVPVVGLPASPAPTQVTVGNGTVCALIGGEVYCWGSSTNNVTGTGHTPAANCFGISQYCEPPGSPVVQALAGGGVGGPLTGVTYVYFGYFFGCAITNTNGLYCWGVGPSGAVAGAEPLPLSAGGTPSNVTHVTSYNAEDFSGADFSESDGTYYVGTTNHAVITCQ